MFSFHVNQVLYLSFLVIVVQRAEEKGYNEISILCLDSYPKDFALSKSLMLFTSKIPQS